MINAILATAFAILGVTAFATGFFLFPSQEERLRVIMNHDRPSEKAAIHKQDNMRYAFYLISFVMIIAAVIIGQPFN
ncbi:MAG: hypothetical protein JWN75_649 [Candidatus Saccharibacteria bacterium]|nr:hypothetical protein [Candidatus Saccharibacteria bacterium]